MLKEGYEELELLGYALNELHLTLRRSNAVAPKSITPRRRVAT